MIVGNYYINNFLVLGLVLAVGGGTAYVADVPGMLDGGSSQSSGDYNVSLLSATTEAGSSQVIRFVGDDGSPVSGAEVSVNGETVGTTGESGELAFEVPDSEEMTVLASKSDVEVTRTYDVEDSNQDEDGSSDGDSDSSDDDSGDQDQDSGQEGSDDQQDQQDGNDGSNQDNSTQRDNETSQGDETFQPTFIQKVSPENSDLQSGSFDLILELGANNSRYEVSLGGEQKLSGEIDGNKTVSSTLDMPGNGTVGLQVEILKDGAVEASENYSLTYNEEVDEEGENDSEVENNVTAELSEVSTVNVGEEINFDASGSTGVIEDFTWQFGDGEVEVTQSSEVQHSYSEKGTYDVGLTVEGPNGSSDSTAISVSVEQEGESSTPDPEINFISPVEGLETDQESLDYEFEVNNSEQDAEYKIMIGQSAEASGTLNKGNNTIQETVQIPESSFNTSIRVIQDEGTYSSEKRTVNPSSSVPEPDIFLRAPQEGSEYSSTEVEYNFTVYNGVEGSTYRVIADGNSVKTGQISGDGTSTLDPAVTVPEGEFTTNVVIDQGGQTYTSETKTVTAGISNTPDIQLVSPSDEESVSTFDSQTEVTFEYEVNDKGWAELAELLINDQKEAETQLYSENSTKTETITLDSGNSYNWEVQYSDGDSQQTSTSTRTLDVVQEQPVDSVALNVEESVGENWEAGFNMTIDTEVERTLKLIVDGEERYSNDIREPVSDSFNQTLIFESQGEYEAEAVLYEIGTNNIVETSNNITFETTEDAPTGGGSSD